MSDLEMSNRFFVACTRARRDLFGPHPGGELEDVDGLWKEWDSTYCMGGEL